MTGQNEKAAAFRDLHHRKSAFVIPNPWDVGTARLLAQLGYEALATTGAGYAFARGRQDGSLDRDQMMAYVGEIVDATELPVSADLEDGFGVEPEAVAETIAIGAECGLAGASIEDIQPGRGALHDRALAVERVRAAAETKRALPFPFTLTLTGRCENYLVNNPDLGDTIDRLCAYQEAGADVLYAPGLTDRDEIAMLVHSVDRPVNVVMGLVGAPYTVAELSELDVARISLGSTLSRVALGAFVRAAREALDKGTFAFASEAIPYSEINERFGPGIDW